MLEVPHCCLDTVERRSTDSFKSLVRLSHYFNKHTGKEVYHGPVVGCCISTAGRRLKVLWDGYYVCTLEDRAFE